MRRVTVTFLILLGLATLASGQLWMLGKAISAGHGTLLDNVLALLSALLLLVALPAMGRILYRTAPARCAGNAQDQEEEPYA